MALLDKIKKVLDEKIEEKEKAIPVDFKATVIEVSESGVFVVEDTDGIKFKIQLEEDLEVGVEVNVVSEMSPEKIQEEKDMEDDDMDDEDDDEEMDDKDKKKNKKEKVDVKEALAKIFKEANIDESLAGDLETLFGVVVDEKVQEIVAEKSTEYEEYQEEQLANAIADMTESVDKYLSYTAKEWLKENEIQVEQGITMEISENLINGLKTIFEDSYVEVPESKVDLVKEAEETIDSLLSTVDEEKERADALQEIVNSMKAEKIVDEVASDLTDVQREKLGTLIDSVEYDDDKSYKQKIQVVVENYFSGKKEDSGKENLDEDNKGGDEQNNDRMSMFVKHLKKKD